MKPRRLIEAEGSAGAELALALERIAALEARQDRAQFLAYRHNERLAAVEERLHLNAPPEAIRSPLTIEGAAKKARRSRETVRKWVRQGRIRYERRGVRVFIDGDQPLTPPRK